MAGRSITQNKKGFNSPPLQVTIIRKKILAFFMHQYSHKHTKNDFYKQTESHVISLIFNIKKDDIISATQRRNLIMVACTE